MITLLATSSNKSPSYGSTDVGSGRCRASPETVQRLYAGLSHKPRMGWVLVLRLTTPSDGAVDVACTLWPDTANELKGAAGRLLVDCAVVVSSSVARDKKAVDTSFASLYNVACEVQSDSSVCAASALFIVTLLTSVPWPVMWCVRMGVWFSAAGDKCHCPGLVPVNSGRGKQESPDRYARRQETKQCCGFHGPCHDIWE
jgi:hypothetical protein